MSFKLINAAVTSLLENALHQVIQADPNSKDLFSDLEGKSLLIDIQDCDLCVLILACHDRIQLRLNSDRNFCTRMAGNSAQFLHFIQNFQHPGALIQSGLSITGDPGVLEAYLRFFKKLDLNLASFLSLYVGDTATCALQKSGKFLASSLSNAAGKIRQNLKECLEEEWQVLVGSTEYEQFIDQLYSLRLEVERLQARLSEKEAASV